MREGNLCRGTAPITDRGRQEQEQVNREPTEAQKKGKKIRTAGQKRQPPCSKKNGFRLRGCTRGVGGDLKTTHI